MSRKDLVSRFCPVTDFIWLIVETKSGVLNHQHEATLFPKCIHAGPMFEPNNCSHQYVNVTSKIGSEMTCSLISIGQPNLHADFVPSTTIQSQRQQYGF